MKNLFTNVLSSKNTTLVFLVAYMLLMAVATCIEKFYGTQIAKELIYYSPLFIFLQLLLILNFLLVSTRYQLLKKKKWSYLLVHLALVVILGGAMTTHITSKEGLIHLRKGERTCIFLVKDGENQYTETLPFDFELTDFKILRYPGSQSPSSYESYLKVYVDGKTLYEKIYMNNVLDLKGYRFFQASYDPDEQGSILSVNYDASGRHITYTGYTLLFLGLFAMLFDKHSRFTYLWKQLRFGCVIGLVALQGFCGHSYAQSASISKEHASRFGNLPMQSANGRIIPINTFATEIVRKFHAQNILGNLSADQFLLSILTFPSDWANIPIIEIKDPDIAHNFGWTKERISYKEAFNSQNKYLLSESIEKIYRMNPSERNRTDKELLKIDDRLNILHNLLTNHFIRILPQDSDTLNFRWKSVGELITQEKDLLSDEERHGLYITRSYLNEVRKAAISGDWKAADSLLNAVQSYQLAHTKTDLIHLSKLNAEVVYNKINLLKWCKIGYLLLGGILLIFGFLKPSTQQSFTWNKLTVQIITTGILLFFLFHTCNLCMRWYISGHAPWSNSYETMVSLAWAGILCGFVFARSNHMVLALATLFSGVVLFVSGLNWMDPEITPLVPVLKSSWLMAHVATLIIAYGFLGICCMIGTSYLLLTLSNKKGVLQSLPQLSIINELSMMLGVAFLAVGIFLGAIWANESWGRYWSWDPKETWALITLITYSVVLHFRWFQTSKSNKLFHWFSQMSFLTILMTFLGVNYFLSGMHSYGSHNALSSIPVWGYVLFICFFILPGLLSFLKNKK